MDFVDILKRIVGTDEVVEIDGVRWGERFLQHTYTPFVDNRSDIFIDLTDVTERRLAEASVRQSEKRFRSIFEQSNDAIFLLDPTNEEILDVNPKACRILGYAREELLKLPISAIHPNEVHRMQEFCGSVLKDGQGWTEDLTCTTIRGQSLAVEISASAASIAGRSCMIAMVRDQTAKVRTSQVLADEVQANYNYEEIIGDSGALREVLNQVGLVASTDTSVLILGESGTGKELICRALHHQSPRSAEPLIKMNCAAIPSGLIESELFGHEKGAFKGAVAQKRGRFELAHEGTIFLDEIGDLPVETQPKLLRLLQDQEFERVGGTRTIEVNVRIVAATHRNLEEMVREGDFREDLFYRLNVFPIRLPPLRERPEDIPLLAAYFAQKACAAMGKSTGRISDQALRRLQGYPWPGNVRELQNIIERGTFVVIGVPGSIEQNLILEVVMTLATTARMTAPVALPSAPGFVEEEQLIENTREGDLRAFELLVERYQPRVNRVTMSVLKNTADAEEVAQDVFLTVFGKIEHFRGDSSFWTWIHRIAVNSALMRRRRLKTNTHMSLEEVMPSFDERGYIKGSVVDGSHSARDSAIQEEERVRIKEAVARLEYKYRIVFVLRQLEDLSTEETARILGLTTAAVKSRLHRARLFLRSDLADYFAEYLN